MNITIDIQVACEGDDSPEPHQIRSWLEFILQHPQLAPALSTTKPVEISLRLVDASESQQLNHQYRGKQSPTNVLSFPAELPDDIPVQLLGDIVICAEVVAREAIEQHKSLAAHWAHMLTHGTLHLLGYDHINDADADVMEALETDIIKSMGFAPPYQHNEITNIHATAHH